MRWHWNLSATLSCWSLCLCVVSASGSKPWSLLPSLSLPHRRCLCVCVFVWLAGRGRLTEELLRRASAVFSGDSRCEQSVGKPQPLSLTSPSLCLNFPVHPTGSLSCSFCERDFSLTSHLLSQYLLQVLLIASFYAPLSSFSLTLFNLLLYLFQSCVETLSAFLFLQTAASDVGLIPMAQYTHYPNKLTADQMFLENTVKCSYVRIRLNTAKKNKKQTNSVTP